MYTARSRSAGAPAADVYLRQLHSAERSLLKSAQSLAFGELRNVRIVNGRPDLAEMDPVEMFRCSSKRPDSRPRALSDFKLNQRQLAFIAKLRSLPSGAVVDVRVQHGLPMSLHVHKSNRASP